ncbi:MAG: sigma-54-dependent Fis family transcriptional regulator [Planctomycetes bacterium]|nr:sigma-54-dependent Fis family transcriptional regulator [Planctomycetota bacterium]
MSRDDLLAETLASALSAWRERGRLTDLLHPISRCLFEALHAERAAFFTITSTGGYHARLNRNADGDAQPDLERWVSHFAVQRALAQGEPAFHADTRQDRRFRTESEVEHGVRTRSLLVVPIDGAAERGVLYLDSRFRDMNYDAAAARLVAIARDLLALALRLEAVNAEAQALRRKVERLEHAAAAAPPAPRAATVAAAPAVSQPLEFHGFVTASPALVAALRDATDLARSQIPVLIEGASGTGKELLARAIHAESGRTGAFVLIHCGTIPDTLVETELFGHARGAFTGADRERSGLIAAAAGGTLFLDDVGEMTPAMQTALLRVLETGRYRRVSEAVERNADIRVVSASRASWSDGTLQAKLRADLYFRLAAATVKIPPLCERTEDIVPLVEYFFRKHGGEEGGGALGEAERAALYAYSWPGNGRELENMVRRLIALGDKKLTRERIAEITGARQSAESGGGTELRAVIDRAERDQILRALERSGGNKSRACKILGLSRKTLYRRLEKHGIRP